MLPSEPLEGQPVKTQRPPGGLSALPTLKFAISLPLHSPPQFAKPVLGLVTLVSRDNVWPGYLMALVGGVDGTR